MPRPLWSRLVLSLAAVATVLSCAGCHERAETGPVDITLWHPWGTDDVKNLQQVVDLYNAKHPDVRIRLSFMGTDLASNQKLFTAIAADRPPDMAFVDGTQDSQFAEWGALEPMDRFIARDHVRAEDFYPPCWRQSEYKGHVWSLTYCADPNFAFCWNKEMFRKAGLDPNRPPRTIAEVDAMSRRLEKMDGHGNIVQLGIIPWGQYGSANSVFTWGWAFGGSFYDPQAQEVTANNPKVVAALTWMTAYAKRLGITKINGSTSTWGSEANSPFLTGQLAMQCMHISTAQKFKEYRPDLDWGMTVIPGVPKTGELGSSWVGGWSLGIPRGSRHAEQAWQFIRWICATPEGTTAMARYTKLLPGYRKSPAIAEARKDPQMRMFVRILEGTKHQRPVMPAQAFYMGALDRAVERALYGKQTPKEALDQADHETQGELDLALGRKVE